MQPTDKRLGQGQDWQLREAHEEEGWACGHRAALEIPSPNNGAIRQIKASKKIVEGTIQIQEMIFFYNYSHSIRWSIIVPHQGKGASIKSEYMIFIRIEIVKILIKGYA